jgi:hypothetical protein
MPRLLPLVLLGACAAPLVPVGPAAIRPDVSPPIGPVPAASPSTVRWALPPCPLRYEILTTERFAPALGSATELVTFMTVDATTSGGHLELKATPTSAMKNGKYRPYAVPDTGFLPLALATDGARWRRLDASSVLYTAFGSQGGLAWLLPDLPDAGEGSWPFPVDERTLNQNGVWFASSRNVMSPPASETVLGPLRQEASRADGRLVLRARGPERWSSSSGPGAFAVLDRQGEIRTEHVVLANGRVLGAHLERDVELTFTVQQREPMRSRLEQRSDAHLVSACDGPTEPRLEPVLTREERAIAAVGELAVALVAETRPPSTLDAFSRRARSGHKDEAIFQTIDRFRKDRGDTWWPLPLFVEDGDVASTPDRIELTLSTNLKSPSRSHTVTPAAFRFEIVEEDGRLVIDRVTAAFALEPGHARVLEIAKGVLFP